MSPSNPKNIDEALAALRSCQEREAKKYGEQKSELGRLSNEAPAPDPCIDAFNRLVQETLDYGGPLGDLELGAFREDIQRVVAVRREAKNRRNPDA